MRLDAHLDATRIWLCAQRSPWPTTSQRPSRSSGASARLGPARRSTSWSVPASLPSSERPCFARRPTISVEGSTSPTLPTRSRRSTGRCPLMLIDANLLLYAVHQRAEQHATAADWLTEQLNGPRRVGLPWQSLAAF